MSDNPIHSPYTRTNPFDQEAIDDLFSPISEAYNASEAGYSQEVHESMQPVRDHFFDNLLIDLDHNSTIEELQEAIMRCKHLFLATPGEFEPKRIRLLNRLFVLRRMLHSLRENRLEDDTRPASRIFRTASATSSLTGLSNMSFSFTRLRSSSLHSLPPSPEAKHRSSLGTDISHHGGHDFHSVFPLRFLGMVCEYCMHPIRDLSRRIFHCSTCHIVCHTQQCHRGLTRRCPRAVENVLQTAITCPSSVSQLTDCVQPSTVDTSENVCVLNRTEDSSGNLPLLRTDPIDFTADMLKPFDFRHLEVTDLSYLNASLSSQYWTCFECHRPIKCIPPSYTVPAEHSVMDTLIKKTSEVFESSVLSLTKQATEVEPVHTSPPYWMPQLRTQSSFLSNRVDQLLKPDPVIVTPTQRSSVDFHWACFPGSEDFGPVQTWDDVRVLEAINRIRSSSAQPFPVKLLFKKTAGRAASEFLPQVSSIYPRNSAGFDQARLCYYTGRFYCSRCHWSDSSIIPACVFVLGDYRPKPVCRSAFLWLIYSWSRHLFRVPDAWYRYDPGARNVCALRLRIFRLKLYLDCCEKLRALQSTFGFSNTYWFLEQPYTFTMALVSSVLDGTLAAKLTTFLAKADEHIDSCQICLSSVSENCCVCTRGPIRVYNPESTFCHVCHRVCHRSCIITPTVTATVESSNDIPPEGDWLEVLSPTIRTFCPDCATTNGRHL